MMNKMDKEKSSKENENFRMMVMIALLTVGNFYNVYKNL